MHTTNSNFKYFMLICVAELLRVCRIDLELTRTSSGAVATSSESLAFCSKSGTSDSSSKRPSSIHCCKQRLIRGLNLRISEPSILLEMGSRHSSRHSSLQSQGSSPEYAVKTDPCLLPARNSAASVSIPRCIISGRTCRSSSILVRELCPTASRYAVTAAIYWLSFHLSPSRLVLPNVNRSRFLWSLSQFRS